MSDYFNATGTIGFTCDNCGRELLGCTWVNGMKFCAKCYQETFGNNTSQFVDLLNKEMYELKIADLEAKLAESEERIKWFVEAEWNKKWANKYIEMRRKEEPKLLFPDSDEVYQRYFEQTDEIDQLKQQLAEKENQYQDAVANCVNLANTRTILKLHKVQDRIDDMKSKYDCDIEYHLGANNELTHLWEYIDKLIEEIE